VDAHARKYGATAARSSSCRSRWLAAGLLLLAVSGCSAEKRDGPTTPATGSLDVTVTLSRSGGLGPTFDHVPQHDVALTVTDGAGDSRPGRTDDAGEAHFALVPGSYVVDVNPYCPDAPKPVTVLRDQVAEVRFDCVAP
jgi:hypothetical protein